MGRGNGYAGSPARSTGSAAHKREVGAVGLVHQETCSVGAACGGDFFHIRDHAVIGGEVMHTVRMDSCSESAAETCSAVGLSRYTGVRSSSAMAL